MNPDDLHDEFKQREQVAADMAETVGNMADMFVLMRERGLNDMQAGYVVGTFFAQLVNTHPDSQQAKR